MTGSMPYVLDKGAYFEVIESILSDPTSRVAALQALRNPNQSLADLCGFDSTNLGTPATPGVPRSGSGDRRTPDERIAHFNKDWLGKVPDGAGGWQDSGLFPTGFWTGFQGNPEAILRDALKRAIEVSLDLEPDAKAGAVWKLTRKWPIDLYWVCQGPVFQCWVLWRQSDISSEGHVTVLITTPAAQGYPLTSKITRPVTGPGPYTAPDYSSPPPKAARRNRRGMWVLGHEDYDMKVKYSTTPSPIGVITMPSVEWRAKDPTTVVCVSPAEWEGGVLPDGRPYAAP
jgi:hypothetical protein